MEQKNLPSNSNASKNWPTSSLVSAERMIQAYKQYGDDFYELVVKRYEQAPPTIIDAANSQAPTLQDVATYFQKGAILLWLRYHIANTFAFVGIYDTVSREQVIHTAELIFDHECFSQLNLDEFLLFLKYFKRGDYGKIYQSARPNPQEFLACLTPFWNNLVEHRIQRYRKEEEERQRKQDKSDEAISYEEYKKRLADDNVAQFTDRASLNLASTGSNAQEL